MTRISFAPAALAIAPDSEVEATTASCAKAEDEKFKNNIQPVKNIKTLILRPVKTLFNFCMGDLLCIKKQAAMIKDATMIMVELVGISKTKDR